MAMDLPTLRKLVALDVNDPLSRFALGKKLFEEGGTPEALSEAADHLRFANDNAPDHLATYHILGQTLIRLGRIEEAKRVLPEPGHQRPTANLLPLKSFAAAGPVPAQSCCTASRCRRCDLTKRTFVPTNNPFHLLWLW